MSVTSTSPHASPQQVADEAALASLVDRLAPIIDRGEIIAAKLVDALLPSGLLSTLADAAVAEELVELQQHAIKRWEAFDELQEAMRRANVKVPKLMKEAQQQQQELLELLQQRKVLDSEILTIVDRHFRDAVRPVLITTFGANVVSPKMDASQRYTEMVNRFFAKVLEQRQDQFWRARTALELRKWSSTVMANELRDRLRRKKRGEEIQDELNVLAESRRQHFEKYHQTEFDAVLDLIKKWESHGTSKQKQWADVLRHRYVDGMSYEDVAHQIGCSVARTKQLHAEALSAAKSELSS